MFPSRALAYLLAAAWLAGYTTEGLAQARPPNLRVIAVTGQPAPGAGTGVTFSGLNAPRIDANASVTFGAFLAGPNLTTGHMGIFVERDGVLQLVVQRGTPVPAAGPGVMIATTGFSPLNPQIIDERVAFRSPLSGTGGALNLGGGIFKETAAGLRLVALAAQQAPGQATGVTLGVGEPLFVGPGNIVFGSFLSGTGVTSANDESIYTDRSGVLAPIVREGARAPGTTLVFGAGSSQFAPGALRSFTSNAQSRLFLHANLSGSGVDDLNDEALYVEGSSGLTLLARERVQAPGQASGVRFGGTVGTTFGEVVPIVLSSTGAAFFQANISGNNVNATFADTLWTNRSGALQLLVRGRSLGSTPKGDAAPGFPNRTFVGFTNFARINPSDRIAFVGVVEGAPNTADTDFGIFSDRTGTLARVVGDGMGVPDQPGVLFGGVNARNTYELLGLTSGNQVLFTTAVRGNVPAGTAGLFSAAPNASIRTLLQTGDLIDVAGDGSDVRRLLTFFVGGVNPDGVVSISLFFDNQTQAIVTLH